jgi:D-3-phosphoglycerate dehydrogenase / 2-oxoglutarate reductase
MPRIFLTHPPQVRESYYGAQAVAGLQALAEVSVNLAGHELTTRELIDAARGCEIIVSHRGVAAGPELFRSLSDLIAFCRCAIDIRNVNVAAASESGILVTQASAGFIASVTEWIIAVMVDLGRNISAATASYHAGNVPPATMGRQLRGSTLGVIGYGQIARYLCELGLALGMRVLVYDPYVNVANAALRQTHMPGLLAESDYVVCLAIANDETERLIDGEALARMKASAFFVNASRGDLVDEIALRRALDESRIAGCAIDVGRAPDQMPTPALARHAKVIATPRIGGLTPEAIAHQALETVAQVTEILQGRVPKGAVNADRATRLARLRGP